MNKILVSRDNIISRVNNVLVNDNRIIFMESGKYFLGYDSNDINLNIEVDNYVDVILYESSFDKDLVVNNKYIVKNGSLVVNKFYSNESVDEKIDILLCNNKSKIDYKFSNICKNKEEYIINIYHNSKNTVSNIMNKSIAMSNSKIDFIINSNVLKEYDGSILDQNTRIITIGDCEAKICPNMYIDCDDVEARHGSVVGTFKEEMLFYLMSRGIEYNDAVKLLVKGFLFSNIELDNELREKEFKIIDKYWR